MWYDRSNKGIWSTWPTTKRTEFLIQVPLGRRSQPLDHHEIGIQMLHPESDWSFVDFPVFPEGPGRAFAHLIVRMKLALITLKFYQTPLVYFYKRCDDDYCSLAAQDVGFSSKTKLSSFSWRSNLKEFAPTSPEKKIVKPLLRIRLFILLFFPLFLFWSSLCWKIF